MEASRGIRIGLPAAAVATAFDGGGKLLRDTSSNDSIVEQIVDLSGLPVGAHLWAGDHFGGSNTDDARLVVRFLDTGGTELSRVNLAYATDENRAYETVLLWRDERTPIPAGATRAAIRIEFRDVCCSGSFGLADDIRLVLSSVDTGNPVLLPGTGEDLRLLTGINSSPSSGPGNEVKLAKANDVLTFEVISPMDPYDFAPLMVGASVFSPPAPFPLLLPDVWLNTNDVILILNGLGCGGFGCSAVVPGGTIGNVSIPAGLNGLTIRIQALASTPPGAATTPANGAYASTEAHEVLVQ